MKAGYGVEDTRKAIQEARRNGQAVFGITIDSKAQSYFPHIFGAGGFAILEPSGPADERPPRPLSASRHVTGRVPFGPSRLLSGADN